MGFDTIEINLVKPLKGMAYVREGYSSSILSNEIPPLSWPKRIHANISNIKF